MNIYDRIKKDHDDARELIKKLKDTTDRAEKTRRELFDKLKLDMWAHHKVEEAVFYAYLRDRTEMSSEAYEALNEHHVANGLLEELDTFPVDSEEWAVKLGALSEIVEHHMDEEEEEFFEEARKILDDSIAEKMGEEFDERKEAVLKSITPVAASDLEAA